MAPEEEEESTLSEEEQKAEKEQQAIDRAKEYEELFAESRRKQVEARERAISAKAREWLSGRWNEKKYSSAAGIEVEASRGGVEILASTRRRPFRLILAASARVALVPTLEKRA